MYALYSVLLRLALLAYMPAFLARRRRAGYGHDLAQRFGRLGGGLPTEPRCWVHAVSVGESAVAVPLVEAIHRRSPELGIVVSTLTPTGAPIVAGPLPRPPAPPHLSPRPPGPPPPAPLA